MLENLCWEWKTQLARESCNRELKSDCAVQKSVKMWKCGKRETFSRTFPSCADMTGRRLIESQSEWNGKWKQCEVSSRSSPPLFGFGRNYNYHLPEIVIASYQCYCSLSTHLFKLKLWAGMWGGLLLTYSSEISSCLCISLKAMLFV